MNEKILILSHNALSKIQNNGKTIEAFFREWNKECIAQIYLQPDEPDYSFCGKYYCMNDYEVLNYYISHGRIGHVVANDGNEGQIINLGSAIRYLYCQKSMTGANRKGVNAYIHKRFVERKPIFVLAREVLWRCAPWKKSDLFKWIDEYRPEVLFFQGGSCHFSYDIALTICKKYRIPLILELTDDYTYIQNKYSLIERINKTNYLRIFRKAIKCSKTIIAISSYMADEYQRRFGGHYEVMLNSVEEYKFKAKPQRDRVMLLYAGNVSLNRWKTLLSIGKALEELGKEITGFSVSLNIYTPRPMEEKIMSRFAGISTIKYGGSLSPEELKIAIKESDYLVHVESFDKRMKKITRLSISTKIPEYLASNRCIYAIGPADIASIKYLEENGAAIISKSLTSTAIKRDLLYMFNDEHIKNECIKNARILFVKNHQAKDTHRNIERIVAKALNKE